MLNKRILILENKHFDSEYSTSNQNSSLKLSLEDNGFKVDLYSATVVSLSTPIFRSSASNASTLRMFLAIGSFMSDFHCTNTDPGIWPNS